MSKSTFVIGLFLSILGFVAIIVSWSVFQKDSKLIEDGHSTNATLISKEIINNSDGDGDYLLSYHFTMQNGKMIYTKKTVSPELWSNLNEGQEFVVYYDNKNPKENLPKGSGNIWIMVPVIISLIGSAFSLFGVMLMFGKVTKLVRNRV